MPGCEDFQISLACSFYKPFSLPYSFQLHVVVVVVVVVSHHDFTIIVPNLVTGRKGDWKLNGNLLRYQHSWIDRQIDQPLLVLLGVEL